MYTSDLLITVYLVFMCPDSSWRWGLVSSPACIPFPQHTVWQHCNFHGRSRWAQCPNQYCGPCCLPSGAPAVVASPTRKEKKFELGMKVSTRQTTIFFIYKNMVRMFSNIHWAIKDKTTTKLSPQIFLSVLGVKIVTASRFVASHLKFKLARFPTVRAGWHLRWLVLRRHPQGFTASIITHHL